MTKKMILSTCLTILIGLSAFTQNYTILVQPAGSKNWGYADLSGNLIIDAKYSKCISFSEDGFAAIYDAKLKQFYFINLKGETLPTENTDFKLYEVFGFGMKGFDDGMAPVKINDKWGYINTAGKLVIQAKYDKMTSFNGGYAAVQRDGKFYAIDQKGVEYMLLTTGVADLNNYSERMASFKTTEDLIGFVDGSGKVVIPPKFKAAGDFHGGLAWAKSSAGFVGYINQQGAWVVEPQFEAGKDYDHESGLARVKSGDKWAFVNKEGEILYVNDTEIYEDFFNGLSRGRMDGKFGFFNTKGAWVIKPEFDGARDFKNGYASVKKGELWGVIDVKGKMVIDPKFEDIKDVVIVK